MVWRFDRALGIEFVSLSEQVDTSTPTGKMVFTVLGAVAELERSLIAERVRAGLRNARAKGKRLGRPRLAVDAARVASLRAQGASWPQIARELSVSVGTVYQAARSLSKNLSASASANSYPLREKNKYVARISAGEVSLEVRLYSPAVSHTQA